MEKIAYFRQIKYKDDEVVLRMTFLIQDGVELKGDIVGKAWKYQKMGGINCSSSLNKQAGNKLQKAIVDGLLNYKTLDNSH